MKTIIIGDVHGRSTWRRILDEQEWDKVVFVGDYFDSLRIPIHEQVTNFIRILSYKRCMPDKVVLLAGNHDYHYMPSVEERASGFNPITHMHALPLLHEFLRTGELQACYVDDHVMVSHAGVTNTWCVYNGIRVDVTPNELQESINDLFRYRLSAFAFNGSDPHGDDPTQGPFWVRPNSMRHDALPGYLHIVGHTQVDAISANPTPLHIKSAAESRAVEHEAGLWLIDALHAGQYMVYERHDVGGDGGSYTTEFQIKTVSTK